jgi:radical SAM superfamily enzyme YgiQ (UPF0313 family)
MKAEKRRIINRIRRETGVELIVASKSANKFSDFNEACEYAIKSQMERDARKILKTEKDIEFFFEKITNPDTPNDDLIEASRKYKELITKKPNE